MIGDSVLVCNACAHMQTIPAHDDLPRACENCAEPHPREFRGDNAQDLAEEYSCMVLDAA